jgi:hypothetical protein
MGMEPETIQSAIGAEIYGTIDEDEPIMLTTAGLIVQAN